MGADQAADPGKGVVLSNQLHSFRITPLADQAYITGDIDARGTGHLTGGWGKDVTIARWTIVSYDMTFVYFPISGQTFRGNLAESVTLLVVAFQKTVCQ
jgi:hypothetical protein